MRRGAARGRRGHRRRDHRRGAQLRRRVQRRDGRGPSRPPCSWRSAASSNWRRRAAGADAEHAASPALDGAYELGRGEARSGRTMDALLAAYRVGARVSWRDLSRHARSPAGLTAEQLARFAELVFAYIDQLSAASVAGHSRRAGDHRPGARSATSSGWPNLLLAGAPAPELAAAAERADWAPPRTLTAVLLPEAQVRGALRLPRRPHPPGDRGGARCRTRRRARRPARARRRGRGPGRPCCGRWTGGARSSGRPGPGPRCTPPTPGRCARCGSG